MLNNTKNRYVCYPNMYACVNVCVCVDSKRRYPPFLSNITPAAHGLSQLGSRKFMARLLFW